MGVLPWIARHATRLMAVGVVVGLCAPPLAGLLRPLLVPALVIPLALALLRLDWSAVATYRRRGVMLAVLLVWLLVLCPILVWLSSSALGAAGLPLSLHKAVVLMSASSPIVSSVAIALMVGLDAALAIVAVIASTALVPLTLPAMASMLLGLQLDISLPVFMGRLAALVGGAFVAAWLIRRFTTAQALRRASDWLDALTVVNLVVFAIAIMDGVTAFAVQRPLYALTAVALAFAANLLLQGAGVIAFRPLGVRRALTVGLLSGNCNMGLVLVALEGRESFDVTVFFALAQLPMYMLPALLQPVYGALASRA